MKGNAGLKEAGNAYRSKTMAEAIANSRHGVDVDLLKSYAKNTGVLQDVVQLLEEAKGSGFP
jgi:hypothetical protein